MSAHNHTTPERDFEAWIREQIATDVANGETLDLFAVPDAEARPRVAEAAAAAPEAVRAVPSRGVTP